MLKWPPSTSTTLPSSPTVRPFNSFAMAFPQLVYEASRAAEAGLIFQAAAIVSIGPAAVRQAGAPSMS
jgi:hypothetical protein